MQHCILGAGRGSYQRLMLGPDEQKRCKAGRLGSTGQGRRSAKKSNHAAADQVLLADGGAIVTRVAVDIYWLGIDWALGADKAAGREG